MKKRIVYLFAGALVGVIIAAMVSSMVFAWLEQQQVAEYSETEMMLLQTYKNQYPKVVLSFLRDEGVGNKRNEKRDKQGLYHVRFESDSASYNLGILGTDSLSNIGRKLASELQGKMLNAVQYDSLRVSFHTFRTDSTYNTINKRFEPNKMGIFNEQYTFCISTK